MENTSSTLSTCADTAAFSEEITENTAADISEGEPAVTADADTVSTAKADADNSGEAEGDNIGGTVLDSGNVILSCNELCKSYGDIKALSGITFDIPEGKIIGLLGPNGSGKTTFIKIVAGLLTADAGTVTVDGLDIGPESKARVAYLPERNSIPEHYTVTDAIDFYADFFADFDRIRAEQMLSDLGVNSRMKIKSLSKGTKEKVQLVMVMARRARLYILDEPISGVDPAARDYIIDTILKNYSPRSSVIISTHLISDIEKAMDGFIFLKYGKIACIGTPEGLKKTLGKSVDEYFREVFRC